MEEDLLELGDIVNLRGLFLGKGGKICLQTKWSIRSKLTRIFLLRPGWGASPSQGYPLNLPVPIYTPRWREPL